MEFEYLSALAFVRPDLGQQLISDLHIATERPVRVITTLPIFEKGSAQRTIDQMRPQLVLIDAEVDGYSLPDVRSLREEAKFPLGVVGLAQPGSSQMEAMLDVHLDAVFNLPLNPGTIERICTELPSQFQALAAQWGKGAWGAGVPETIRTATAAAGVSSWQRQVIGVWAPKGGVGKTTIACEMATTLAAIGGRKVAQHEWGARAPAAKCRRPLRHSQRRLCIPHEQGTPLSGGRHTPANRGAHDCGERRSQFEGSGRRDEHGAVQTRTSSRRGRHGVRPIPFTASFKKL